MEENKHMTVKEFAKEDRPREKMIAIGKKNLTNAELIAILLGSGFHGKNAVDLGKEMLSSAGNSLTKLSRIDFAKLKSYKGIGEAKAITILAALELGYRMINEESDEELTKITSSHDLFLFLAPLMIELNHEEFWVVFLNNKHKILGKRKISQGGWASTPVDLRMIFKEALDLSATTIAVAHNHPSGSVTPSKEDKILTEKIATAGNALGIRLMDHIVMGVRTDKEASQHQNWFSFAEHGLL